MSTTRRDAAALAGLLALALALPGPASGGTPHPGLAAQEPPPVEETEASGAEEPDALTDSVSEDGAPALPVSGTDAAGAGAMSPAPRPARASFALRVGRQRVPLRILALAVLPGGQVEIRRDGTAGGRLSAVADGGRLRRSGDDAWSWTAPDAPGFHAVRVAASEPADTIQVTFMVVRPASQIRDGRLNGYQIGSYRTRPPSMSPAYEPPLGFVEARPEDYDVRVSPNFRLGQFLCKQPGDPRYLLVSPRLLIKLEALLEEVNARGYATSSLVVMSGFRTPAYNRAIGNTTDFSRHLWGDAADVYIDADGDDQMDDVNGDGRSDVGDARWLARVVENMMARDDPGATPGGLSIYRRNAAHGPFLHMDARGYRARW